MYNIKNIILRETRSSLILFLFGGEIPSSEDISPPIDRQLIFLKIYYIIYIESEKKIMFDDFDLQICPEEIKFISEEEWEEINS